MRVAIIAPPWVPVPPLGYGGTEFMLDVLARGLVAQGHDVLLFATGDSACPVPTKYVHDRALNTIGGSAGELRHVLHAYEVVRGFDVVHDHTLFGPLYAERFPELRVVTTNHGPFNDELSDLYRAVTPRVAVVAISRAQAATANGIPISRVIHHGIDVDAFPQGDGDGGYVAFLGRLSPDKGAHRAARIARDAGVPLRIAAKMREPAERAYFDEQVAPLLGGGVEYLGEVGPTDRLKLLRDARALVNPITWNEPFGLVMIEALACGTPVLAFPHGAAPEIVDHGHTGFLCADEDAMVHRLGQLDRLDRDACRHAARTRFSATRMVAEHVELYRSVADGDRTAAA